MTADDWTVTSHERLRNGNVRVRGVHHARGPFTLTVTSEEYETAGVWAAIRHYFTDPPTGFRRPS